MQVCPKCGNAIKYIATGFNATTMCDAEKIEIVTEGGHTIKGYIKHVCSESKQEEQENSSE